MFGSFNANLIDCDNFCALHSVRKALPPILLVTDLFWLQQTHPLHLRRVLSAAVPALKSICRCPAASTWALHLAIGPFRQQSTTLEEQHSQHNERQEATTLLNTVPSIPASSPNERFKPPITYFSTALSNKSRLQGLQLNDDHLGQMFNGP